MLIKKFCLLFAKVMLDLHYVFHPQSDSEILNFNSKKKRMGENLLCCSSINFPLVIFNKITSEAFFQPL